MHYFVLQPIPKTTSINLVLHAASFLLFPSREAFSKCEEFIDILIKDVDIKNIYTHRIRTHDPDVVPDVTSFLTIRDFMRTN